MVNLKESASPKLNGDLMFLGSPTRYFGPTSKAKGLLKDMKQLGWKDQPIVLFDTMMGVPDQMSERNKGKWASKGAAPKLRDIARSNGLNAKDMVLHIGVKGLKGPLTDKAAEEHKDIRS